MPKRNAFRPTAWDALEARQVLSHGNASGFLMPIGNLLHAAEREDRDDRGKIAGSYVNSALARSDAQRSGFDDAITLNKDGHIAEGSVANFFMVRNGSVVTPPITDDILEGITRATFMTPRTFQKKGVAKCCCTLPAQKNKSGLVTAWKSMCNTAPSAPSLPPKPTAATMMPA